MDELREHVGYLPLCEFLWDWAWSYSMVHSSWTVQSGTSACSHCSRWLLQLDLQLHHRHDLSIYTGRQKQHKDILSYCIKSDTLLPDLFLSLIFLGVVGCLRVRPVCCAASLLYCVYLSSSPWDQRQDLWGDCCRLPKGTQKVGKGPRVWQRTGASKNFHGCVKQQQQHVCVVNL